MLSGQNPEINIEEYYLRYGPMVLRRCRQLLKDEESARDAAQDVFAKLLMHQKKIKNQYPSSLLFRIATNTCLNILRDDRTRRFHEKEALLESILAYDKNEKRLILKDLVDKIFRKEKPSTYEIAVMHFVDEMTHQEVACETGLSVSGVRKRIREFRSRVKIKREIGHDQ